MVTQVHGIIAKGLNFHPDSPRLMPEMASSDSDPLPTSIPLELSFPLPKAPHTTLHMHLTFMTSSATVFLTTTVIGESGATNAPLGSFVYAMPDVCTASLPNSSYFNQMLRPDVQRVNPPNVISTPLYTSTSSIDYTNRTAKILARKMSMPVYVGCSINFSGITTDEEIEGLRKVIGMVLARWEEHQQKKA
jgi:hypothetical protein